MANSIESIEKEMSGVLKKISDSKAELDLAKRDFLSAKSTGDVEALAVSKVNLARIQEHRDRLKQDFYACNAEIMEIGKRV
ncbi:MAG: hypothetical protein SGI96_21340 [Bacteroidota bacterium]|nr:hypothetical protein [Bacteroidota bacterium]